MRDHRGGGRVLLFMGVGVTACLLSPGEVDAGALAESVRAASSAAAAPELAVAPRGPTVVNRRAARGAGPEADTAGADAGFDTALFGDLKYRYVGPSRGGRVTAVAGHRDQPLTFWMGSTGGGVWKTTDAGHSWKNVSDGAGFTTGSIGAIQVADSDADVVYVGTGSDGIRSNVITGRGVFRTTDGGDSWSYLGLRETGQIGAIEVHPQDADLVYLAALGHPFGENAERGVYRSDDGGQSWEKVLFASDSVGAVDLEMKPGEPGTLYAALWRGERKPWTIISGAKPESGDGIWKSTDGGDSWRRLTAGLPDSLVGKIDLAVSPADPDRVYALVEAPPAQEGLYRSDDSGESWRLVNDDSDGLLMHRPFYFTNVAADPQNADVVYVMGLYFHRSTDGGETFARRPTPHIDNHDMWINPDDPDVFVQSNDGGATVTMDGGESWSSQQNQPTAELYQVDVDGRFPYWLYAGQQDYSTIAVPGLPPSEPATSGPRSWWKDVGGCETGPAVPKPGSRPLVVYANCKGRFGRFSMRTGQEQNYWVGAQDMYGRNPAELTYRFQRTVPIEISPHDPDVVYHGSQYVHRTRSGGLRWERVSPDLTAFPEAQQMPSGGPITRDITGEEHFSALYVIEESPLREGLIWVGSNDGPVHVTRDGGESWRDVTPAAWPDLGRVNAIEPSRFDPGTAYVTGYRYLLDDWQPYVFRTTDYGRSWTRIADGTDGIPGDVPVRVVREDPEREGLLYAGTEFGMYVSFDAGTRWQPLQLNLPVTPVTDIEVQRGDLVLSTMGRGFWILYDLSPLRQVDRTVSSSEIHLYAPRAAHRMRYRSFSGYGERDPAEPDYPPPGAMIDYYLAESADRMELEILDDAGNRVRRYVADADASESGSDLDEEMRRSTAPGSGRGAGRSLERSAGMHRLVWDLRHPGPWRSDGANFGGPLAVPGDYTIRLTVDGETRTRPLRVEMDPRVRAEGVSPSDLEQQLDLNLRIRDALSEARRSAHELASAMEWVRDAHAAGTVTSEREDELIRRIRSVRSRLVTREDGGSYPPPMLIDQLEYLYGMTTAADQAPGDDARARLRELRELLDGLLADAEDALAAAREATGS